LPMILKPSFWNDSMLGPGPVRGRFEEKAGPPNGAAIADGY